MVARVRSVAAMNKTNSFFFYVIFFLIVYSPVGFYERKERIAVDHI